MPFENTDRKLLRIPVGGRMDWQGHENLFSKSFVPYLYLMKR